MLDKIIDKIINWILQILGISKEQKTEKEELIYNKKNFMTEAELNFYHKIKVLEKEYNIIPQINLGTIVEKQNKGYRNELFKNIDFAIFDKNFNDILLLIELNDKTHNKTNRKERDLRVKKICSDANIKLITFYTKYSNEKEYVLKRILEEINKKD